MSKTIEIIHLKVFMYLNDSKREYILKGAEGIDIGMLKLFLLLYADDITLFANTIKSKYFRKLL